MFGPQQAITNPIGVTVFGSATNRVYPDLVSIRGSVSSLEQKPSDAFSKAKRGARSVQDYLGTVQNAEFGVSRAALTREMRFVNGAQQFAGYNARISFRISLTELDRADEVAQGLVAAGMNEIERISFETSKLKEERAEARRMAVAAAVEKAENYCSAADVALGPIIHIEDVNPTVLQAHGHHAPHGPAAPEEDERGALDPSLIDIGGAVYVTFEIIKRS
jgi:uncharacterized protein YggE